MFDEIARACRTAALGAEGIYTPETVATMAETIAPAIARLEVVGEDLPWGRYLAHHDADDLFNIQLDIFSSGYTGSVHSHGAWGGLWLLKGSLRVWDYHESPEGVQLARYGTYRAGSFQVFCPPLSDWHKVGTLDEGPQTVSIHIYGPGFDLDEGRALGEDGKPATYRRGRLGDMERLLPHLRWRA